MPHSFLKTTALACEECNLRTVECVIGRKLVCMVCGLKLVIDKQVQDKKIQDELLRRNQES
jgi:hypothetical protein